MSKELVEEKVRLLTSRSHSKKLLFRGQPNSEWVVVPGIFRCEEMRGNDGLAYKGQHYKNEEQLIIDYKNKHPEYFAQSPYNIISDMQHYRYPTRLVDWSHDPYVALFFVCYSYPEKNGRIFLCEWDNSLNEDEIQLYTEFFSKISITNSVDSIYNLIMGYFSLYKHCIQNNSDRQKAVSKWVANKVIELDKQIGRFVFDPILIGQLTNGVSHDDVPLFTKFLYGLGYMWYLPAPQINERVIAQKGCFVIYPGKLIGNKIIIRNTVFHPEQKIEECAQEPFRSSIIIDYTEKQSILESLDKDFKINSKTLKLDVTEKDFIDSNNMILDLI